MTLSSPLWATLSDAQGVGSITTDDAFTDESLLGTAVRVLHLTELRTNINLLRVAYGLLEQTWSEPIVAGQTMIKGVHLTELRTALNAVYQAAVLPQPTYTDSTITGGVTLIKAVHINELRAAIKAVP